MRVLGIFRLEERNRELGLWLTGADRRRPPRRRARRPRRSSRRPGVAAAGGTRPARLGMTARGLSPTTVRYVHRIMAHALADAVRWGRLVRNPADQVDLPRTAEREMARRAADDVRRFLESVAYDRLLAMWVLLCTTGMRRGEVLGRRPPRRAHRGAPLARRGQRLPAPLLGAQDGAWSPFGAAGHAHGHGPFVPPAPSERREAGGRPRRPSGARLRPARRRCLMTPARHAGIRIARAAS